MAKDTLQDLIEKLDDLYSKAQLNISSVHSLAELQSEKVGYIGRKSQLTSILKDIKNFSAEEKKLIGSKANQIRLHLEELLNKQEDLINKNLIAEKALSEKIDISLPGKKVEVGHTHPITQMRIKAEEIFQRMGFEVYYPYELDDDYHIFSTLNFPDGHPARDNWDTFITDDKHMPIPHTSAMQNRIISSKQPPIRAIVPGRCFRNEATDARHEHTFNQIEGIYVDKGISLAHMLGTLQTFFSNFFEKDLEVKFTPDFFPFVEPGGMMSLSCVLCDSKGCKVCKYSGWLEILGCGMIHPEVLKAAKVDPNVYSGFAWGFGLERLILLKYNIEDIRYFNSGDLKFIRQF